MIVIIGLVTMALAVAIGMAGVLSTGTRTRTGTGRDDPAATAVTAAGARPASARPTTSP